MLTKHALSLLSYTLKPNVSGSVTTSVSGSVVACLGVLVAERADAGSGI
jgi:hypothetical protein